MCRHAAWLVVAAVAVTASAAGGEPPITTPLDHVRPTNERTRKLIEDGLARSASLRNLVEQLQATDVIVYVEQRPMRFEFGLSGSLTFTVATPSFRYLTVSLNIEQTRSDAIAILGHELQHALEVSLAPMVRSRETMGTFYNCIGVEWTDHRWDTQLALEAGQRVRSELARPRGGRARS